MSENIKQIIIADTCPIIRFGVKTFLGSTNDPFPVDEAGSVDEFFENLNKKKFDLAIFDLTLSKSHSLTIIDEVKARMPQLPLIVYTMMPEEMYAIRMFKNGISAYIPKESNLSVLVEAVRSVAKGKKYFTRRQSELLAEALILDEKRSIASHEALSDREFQILFMIASGIRKSDIAEKLQISKNTVGNHRNNILLKMNLKTNADLTRYAINNGLIK
jgi:two-component system, NarL family, invasion response regulator UvrY